MTRANDAVPLELLGPEAPLSPTLERALSDVWADVVSFGQRGDESSEELSLRRELAAQFDAGQSSWASVVASRSSESIVTAATSQERCQSDVMTMSLNETKEGVAGRKLLSPDEAKRARRSAIEKKSRERRRAVLQRMRREVKLLEDEYAHMDKKRDAWAPDSGNVGGGGEPVSAWTRGLELVQSESAVTNLARKCSELTLEAHALIEEQAALRQLLQDREHFKQDVLRVARSEGDNPVSDPFTVYNTGVPRSSSWTADWQPLPTTQCFSIVNDSCGVIRAFDDSGFFESTGVSFLGWTDKRKYDRETLVLQYGFTKQFPLERDPERLLLRTWDTLRDPAGYARVFLEASTALRFRIVQEPSSDLYVLRLDHTRPGSEVTFVSVHMVFYVPTPAGLTLVMRSVPASEIRDALEPHEYLYDIFVWTHFNYIYDDAGRVTGTEIVTGGCIQDARQLMSARWLFEVVLATLRWESHCIAPVFLTNV